MADRDSLDIIRDERKALLRALLFAMLGLLAVATAASALVEGRQAFSIEGLTNNLVMAAAIVAGIWLLSRNVLVPVVWLVAVVVLWIGATSLRFGLDENAAGVLLLIVPIALVGLVLGRGPLLVILAIAVALVGATYWLDAIDSPLLLQSTPESPELSTFIVFTLVAGLLALFLDRFALTLDASLRKSKERELELEREIQTRARLENRLQLATDSAQVGLWSWDLEEGSVDWSPKMRELFAVPEGSEVTLNTFFERVHPEDRDWLREALAEGNVAIDLPYRVVLPDGSLRWLVGRGHVVSEDDRRTMLGVAFDVTGMKEAELERTRLLAKEQEARSAAEAASSRLATLARVGHVLADTLDYPETMDRLAHLMVPDVADWCTVDVLNESGELERLVVAHNDPDKVRFAYELAKEYPSSPDSPAGPYQVLRSGQPNLISEVTDELLRKSATDSRHLEILRSVGIRSALQAPLVSRGRKLGVLTLVQAESGRQIDEEDVAFAMQIAERSALAVDNARLYTEARRLNSELEERVAARTRELEAANEELESFTYTVSHDLRSPLRGIGGFSKILLEDYGEALDATAQDYLQRIDNAANRMSEMIDDLLELSKVSTAEVKRQLVDLSKLANEIVEDLRRQNPERQVEFTVQPGLVVETDPRLVRIALENLLGNAWKYTERKRNAKVRVGRDEAGAFFVNDNGAGFDMRHANKLFAPFQRLHASDEYSGTGIGLATTRRVVERLGGRVWATGEVGKGATFYFSLNPTLATSGVRNGG